MNARAAVVVAGGGPPAVDVHTKLPPEPTVVVGADSGVDTALALGLHINVVVGDLDSVTPDGLARAEADGARVVRHPTAKDATDLELAMHEALSHDSHPDHLIVVGGSGGRLDHLLAGALALADPAYAGAAVTAFLGPATIHVVHGPGTRTLTGTTAGELLTIVPVGGRAEGVRTTGLRYPLREEPLEPGSTRGVNNVVDETPPSVALTTGTVLVVLPGDTDDGGPP